MNSNSGSDPNISLANLESMKQEGERLAKQFKLHRDDLRSEAIYAVTECGVSIVRASAAAGIDRRTLTVWLAVHNAEQKALKRSRD